VTNRKIGLKEVRGLKNNEILWDRSVPGFGVRRQQSETISYFLKYRTSDGRQRWLTIGRHGAPWTPELARQEALKILGQVVAGDDPSALRAEVRHGLTVSDLCDQYLVEAESGRLLTRRKIAKKTSTIATDRGRIDRHIKPLLGSSKVSVVSGADVERFMHAVAEGKTAGKIKTDRKRGLAIVKGGKGAATRTVGLLGAIFSYAVRAGIRSDNPVHGVMRFADGRRDRRLTDSEYQQIDKALCDAQAKAIWPFAIGAIRFLLLSGWRSGEVLGLKWSELDLDRRTARLTDTKTGRSLRPLSARVCAVLRSTPKLSNYVFPASRGDGRMTGFPKIWARIMKANSVSPEVTPHTLRHSYASLASDLGYSEATIAVLVGHRGSSITSRYIHSADAVLVQASDAIAEQIDALSKGVIVNFRERMRVSA
jgi:integrase